MDSKEILKKVLDIEEDGMVVVRDLPGKYLIVIWLRAQDSRRSFEYDRPYYMGLRSPQQQRRKYSMATATAYVATPEDVIATAEGWIKSIEEKENAKAQRRASKMDARKASTLAAIEKIEVGQIYYATWGYDQTNLEFFQVVEVGKKSIKVREIAQRDVGSRGGWGGQAVAIKDRFLENAKVYTRIPELDYQGRVSFRSPVHGYCSPWDGSPISWSDGH